MPDKIAKIEHTRTLDKASHWVVQSLACSKCRYKKGSTKIVKSGIIGENFVFKSLQGGFSALKGYKDKLVAL